MELAVGDCLKWTRNDSQLGRRNGQEFEVFGIEDGQMLIRYGGGNMESLSSFELAHLDYALVSTTYGAQGKSAERVIGALDRSVGRESFYVTVSRVKYDLRLYASEDLDRLAERAEKSRAKENPGEVLHPGKESYKCSDPKYQADLEHSLAPAHQLPNLARANHLVGIEKRRMGLER